MAFSLNTIVPWGRSYEEYIRMFDLSPEELQARIVSCGDGPANFNSEMTKRNGRAVSIDPLYQCTAGQIRQRIGETYDQVMAQLVQNQDDFIWDQIKSPAELGAVRMAAMEGFLADFEKNAAEGRYIANTLPYLPFRNQVFDLALCSHLLFLYSRQLSLAFHRDSIIEMCRVAVEVRIFPLFDLKGTKSPYVTTLADELQKLGYKVAIKQVEYEFQRGANEMMTVSTPSRNDLA